VIVELSVSHYMVLSSFDYLLEVGRDGDDSDDYVQRKKESEFAVILSCEM